MKFNKWTVGLAAVGVVSLASAARADEQMSQIQTALTQTTLSGYVDTAMTWRPGTDANANSGGTAHLPGYSFAKNDGFSLNAIDIALDKPEDSSAWAAGYHVELMFGADSTPLGNAAAFGIPAGSLIGSTGVGSIRSAYIRLHTPVGGNGIDWQVGVFDVPIGYESTTDPSNPNYTRSYGYSIEPTTLTGVLGTYKVNDEISFSGGVADLWNDNIVQVGSVGAYKGLNTVAETESQKAYMGSATFTAPDSMGFLKGATLSGGIIRGVNDQAVGGSETSYYIGATIPTPINQLKVGASFDYLSEADALKTTSGDNVWAVGVYGTVQATDKLSFNLRGEVLQDNSNPGDVVNLYAFTTGAGAGHTVGNTAEEMTATIQYNLWANVLSRAEFRWDHVEHGNPFGASATTGGAYRDNDFMLALNLIYQF